MNDVVRKPSHYQIAPGIEAIDLIELIVNAYDLDPHEGYLLGNFLKYRLRLGDKDSVEQDLAKSNEYRDRLRNSRPPEVVAPSRKDKVRKLPEWQHDAPDKPQMVGRMYPPYD